MQTTINNNHQVFMVYGTGLNTQKYFCNLQDVVKCCKEFEDNQPYIICRFWNNKPYKMSKAKLIDQLEANQLDATFFKTTKPAIV